MAPKKRRSTSLPGVSAAAPPTSAVADPDVPVNQIYDAMDPSSRNDLWRAFLADRRGDPSKSQKLLKETLSRYQNDGYALTVMAKIYLKYCFDVQDPTLHQKYLYKALDASRRAVSLSPGSVNCAIFHAKLLVKVAKDAEGLDEAVRECQRGLNIEFPVGDCKDPAYQAADNARCRLRKLLKNIEESRSNLGTTFSDEFCKYHDSDLEDYLSEFMEDTTSEVKKMDQLTVRNLLNQNLFPSTNMEQMDFFRSSRLYKMEENRKRASLEKVVSSAISNAQTRSYWDTISVVEKLDFLKIRIEDIQTHLSSLNNNLIDKVFSEAVQFAIENKSWKYWGSFDCCKKYKDWDLFKLHLWVKHMHEEPSAVLIDVPEDLDRTWIDKLINCPWKPIDTQKALKMMELGSKDSSFFSEECSVDRAGPDVEESDNHELFVIGSVHEFLMQPAETPVLGEGESSEIDCDDREWPFSEDGNRSQILDRVKISFLALLHNNYLSYKIFCHIVQGAVQELESVIPRTLISKFSLHKSPLSICFLETSKLTQVLGSLSTLANSLCCEENDSSDDEEVSPKERVVFSQDFSSLVLDKRLIAVSVNNMTDNDPVEEDDGCAVISETDDREHEAVSETLDCFPLLVSSSTIEEITIFWARLLIEKKLQNLPTFWDYQTGVEKLRDKLTEISRQSGRRQAICKTKALLMEGIRKSSNLVEQDLESILSKRQQELGMEEPSDDFESSIIGEILMRGCSGSEQIDQSSIHMRNRIIKKALAAMETELSVESSIAEAQRRRLTFEVGKLELKLKSVSGHDYRDFIVPILKCFSKMRLEELALKYAVEKSEAAREALLAELEQDEKSSVHKREGKKGKKPKKSKEKKRNKNIKGAKASEVLPEVEEHENPATQNVHSAMDIQGPLMDMTEDAVVGSAVDERQEDSSHHDIQLEHVHLPDSSDQADGVIADSLVAGTAPRDPGRNFDGNTVNSETSAPKRDERKGKKTKKSKNKKKKKHFSGAKASKEFPYMEEHHNPAKNNLHSASSSRDPPLYDHGPMDMSVVAECEEAVSGTDVDECQEDVRQIDNQFKQLEVSDSDMEADGVIAEDIAAAQSLLQMSGDPPEATRNDFDGNLISSYELGMPSDAKRSFPEREENKGKQTKIRKIKSSELAMPIDGRRDFQFEQTQMSKFNDYEMVGGSSKLIERNIERNVSSPSYLSIDDRNDFHIEAKKDADPRFNKKRFSSLKRDKMKKLNQLGDRNDDRENNCLLNVIIQSLWYLSIFQEKLARISSSHGHTGDPCIICCLLDIFTDLRKAAKKKSTKVVDPTPLRYALSYFSREHNLFPKGRRTDASEVLVSIFYCLHFSVTSALDENGIIVREDRGASGSWGYGNCDCIMHTLFMTDIVESLRCKYCELLSRFANYNFCFHNVNAKKLRNMKLSHWSASFSELLKLVYMDRPRVQCEPRVLGCGVWSHLSCSIRNLRGYFVIVLGWEAVEEFQDNDVSATLASLGTELDMSLVFEGLQKETKYCLVSLVCSLRRSHVCFGYDNTLKEWFLYEDAIVELTGTWEKVVIMCQVRHLRPQVLFFEAVL